MNLKKQFSSNKQQQATITKRFREWSNNVKQGLKHYFRTGVGGRGERLRIRRPPQGCRACKTTSWELQSSKRHRAPAHAASPVNFLINFHPTSQLFLLAHCLRELVLSCSGVEWAELFWRSSWKRTEISILWHKWLLQLFYYRTWIRSGALTAPNLEQVQ